MTDKVKIHVENLKKTFGKLQVLKDITTDIHEGEVVVVIGPSGSGKSTISLCLFRILEATEGTIFIDDVDISQIDLKKLRESISIIPQDPTIMEGTLRFNIDPLNKYSDDEIIEAITKVGLTHLLDKEKNFGLEMNISADGTNISVGEKQLVCIVRALLKKSKIIIMDEATAHIDVNTEKIIQESLKDILPESTFLTMAHRIKTILNYDKVLVLDEGNVAEFDTPQNLLKDKNSKFYQLYHNYEAIYFVNNILNFL